MIVMYKMSQMEILVLKNIIPEILNSMKLKIHFGQEDTINKVEEKSVKILRVRHSVGKESHETKRIKHNCCLWRRDTK